MTKDIKSKKYTGVYYRVLEDESKTYYITYKDPITKKTQRLKIGNSKDGFNEVYSHNKRAELIAKLRLGEDSQIPILKAKSQKLTLNDIAKLYFEHKGLNGVTRSLKSRENKFIKHFGDKIGLLPLQMITKNDILNLQKSLINSGLANATVNTTLQLGSTVFKYSIDEDLYKGVNPFSKVKSISNQNERVRYLTHKEIKQLKNEVSNDEVLSLFVAISLTTGGRLETILNIKKSDININTRLISLYDFKNKSYYTGVLTDEVKNILQNSFKQLKNEDYIISYHNGLKAEKKQIQRRLSPVLNKLFNKHLDLKDTVNRVVIHSLRHTFASLMAIDGTPIYTIKKLMNHKDINQTLRYAKLSPDTGINEVLKVFDK
jgi:integrase